MTLLESLLRIYGANEPISSMEIVFEGYSRPWVCKQLTQLCREGKLIRFEKGIYYIPTNTVFGKSILEPRKVIEKKYIFGDGEVIGYYSGLVLQQQLRLTEQMPNVIELFTNKETSRVREVVVGTQKVLLRRARMPITAENVAVQRFLELMNEMDILSFNPEKKDILGKFIDNESISRKDITAFAPFFPDKTMRNLIESELIYRVANE